jgi:GT2 family glycosyltransferase
MILFVDDGLSVAEDWVEQMEACIWDDGFDGVTGQITLAPQLIRPWMTEAHKMWLAATLSVESRDWSRTLVGANMALRRSVLERVPAFDPELGPGPEAMGFCEEKLFAWQLVEAGFKLGYASNARAIHFFDVLRLQRTHWLIDARRRGRTEAYLRYHWEHADLRAPHLKWLFYSMKLQARRTLQPPPPLESEGCPVWEMSYVSNMEMCRQFCLERQRRRKYSRRGLLKDNR